MQEQHEEQPRRPQQQQQQQQFVTRTRQDLINSGDLFRMNEKFAAEERERNHQESFGRLGGGRASGSGSGRQVSEYCHGLCSLALVVASVISLFLLVSFLRDEPLYEYGEYLLGLGFYRQLVYVLALMPLVLLLPIWNVVAALVVAAAAASDLSSGPSASRPDGQLKRPARGAQGSAGAMLKLRSAYTFLLFSLVLLALIFVAPYISQSSVASQIEFEFRRSLKMRYESEFHYQLLDRIQEAYECCDHMWYRANLQDKVPISCFKPFSNFQLIFDDTCPDVVGKLVSVRCATLGACLFVALLALGCLFALDCERLLNGPSGGRRGEYEVSPPPEGPPTNGTRGEPKNARDANALARTEDSIRAQTALLADAGPANGIPAKPRKDGGDQLPALGRRRLDELDEHERESLLSAQASKLSALLDCEEEHQGRQDDPDGVRQLQESTQSRRSRFLQDRDSPVLLTRADYKTIQRERSQSPVFLSTAATTTPPPPTTTTTTTTTSGARAQTSSSAGARAQAPIKSALKSGSSQQSLSGQQPGGPAGMSTQRDLEDEDNDSLMSDYTERLRKSDSLLRQKQLLRREQLRKSLQSVRFADDNF